MKIIFSFLILALICYSTICSSTNSKESIFLGSTPAHRAVRDFLNISLTDSIDFIRWKIVIRSNQYEVLCEYGLAKAGTPGFSNGKEAAFKGDLTKEKNNYNLKNGSKILAMLEINSNLLHLLDENKNMLVGNGGYSYTLNINIPTKSDQFQLQSKQGTIKKSIVFEGRTPCQELSGILGMNKSSACNKLKWYFIFYVDSMTGKPSHYLSGGTAYRKETMARGNWQIVQGKDGRILYKLNPEKHDYSLYFLKADENILFFVDPDGNLLVGNEDFSYTLNRRNEEYPRFPGSQSFRILVM